MKRTLGVFLILMVKIITSSAIANENIKFSGKLVALPCTIPASDNQIPVHFGTVNVQDLYLGKAMPRIPFVLHLDDCDPTIAGKVSVTFSGTEDLELPGSLALDGSQSEVTGVAIGLERATGEKISLNRSTATYYLIKGENELPFMAFIMGEPTAVKQHAIQSGKLNASATIEINYE